MTMFMTQLRWTTAAIASMASLMLVGCATMGGTPEQAVSQRANAYWKARMASDYKAAYELTTASYRKLRTQEQFRRQFGSTAAVNDAQVYQTTCEPAKCVVRMKLTTTPALPMLNVGTIPLYVDETWLLEDDQWLRYQEP
ncbi:hypothetical protein [Diaphorobacter nitroreducens]|uniref:hypothetical protein n=1 Tax=Diaphorobacter nitroreducens TaxID=164759 RepID=UPI00289B8C6C|nr:hypothetical protein [Diaphorobacter nitroreducens]